MISIKNIILVFTVLSILVSSSLALKDVYGHDGKTVAPELEESLGIVRDPIERADFVLYSRDSYSGIGYEVLDDGTTVAKSGGASVYYTFGDVSVKDGKIRFQGQQNEKLLLFERVRCAENYTAEAVSFAKNDIVLAVFDFKALGQYNGISISPVLRSDYDSEYGEMYLTPFSFLDYANTESKTVSILFEVDHEMDELNYYVFFDGVASQVVSGCKNASKYYFCAFEIGFTIPPSLITTYYEIGNVSVFVHGEDA